MREREGGPSALATDLTEEQWQQLAPLLPAQRRRQGRPRPDLRQMINAMLWIERSGCSWRALPSHFGPGQDVYARYHRWRQSGLWLRIRQTLQPATSEAACA
jgi:transposase